MIDNITFLSDNVLAEIVGGLEIERLLPNGKLNYHPDGFIDHAFPVAKFTGILNGTAPMLGDGNPIKVSLIP